MVYIFLAEGFEEIEAVSIIDVLRRADIKTTIVSITGKKEVTGTHGIKVISDSIFEETNFAEGEMLILPGGMPGTTNLQNHKGLAELLLSYKNEGKWTCAICAAPLVLGELGMLKGVNATCYPGVEEHLKGSNLCGDRVVHHGKIVTSKGPGTAIEFGLKLVEVLKGKEIAQEIADGMIVK